MSHCWDGVKERYNLTLEELEQAKRNGISRKQALRRVREYCWPVERAITEPLQKQSGEWSAIAAANGIKQSTFAMRISRYGWTPEKAATTPLQDRKQAAKRMADNNRRIPTDIIKLAEHNGISYDTLKRRTQKGMNLQTAATRPIMSASERAKLFQLRRLPISKSFHSYLGR